MHVHFLGTGPAHGRPGSGRSRRMESSLLVSAGGSALLVDATRNFTEQAHAIEHVDAVLLTHAHRDASGGAGRLDRWLDAPTPVWAASSTIDKLRVRHRRLRHLELHAIASGTTLTWRDWRITPRLVPHARDCTTFAWRIEHAGSSLVYASDVARLTPALREHAAGCDLLVLDGAMWQRTIFSHLEIQATIPIVARWPVRQIVLTQLGRSTPPHEQLEHWLQAIDPRLHAAYDDLAFDVLTPTAPFSRCPS